MRYTQNSPHTEELATDRRKVFFIENNELVESQLLENGPGKRCSYLKKKKKVMNNRQSDSDSDCSPYSPDSVSEIDRMKQDNTK